MGTVGKANEKNDVAFAVEAALADMGRARGAAGLFVYMVRLARADVALSGVTWVCLDDAEGAQAFKAFFAMAEVTFGMAFFAMGQVTVLTADIAMFQLPTATLF